MEPKAISVKARYCRDCMNAARRMQERCIANGMTEDQRTRLGKVNLETSAADEFARLAAVEAPLQGSDVAPLPDVEGDTPQAITKLLDEAVKVLPLVTSQPESILAGDLRNAARRTETDANDARRAMQLFVAGLD
ncbi:hypothetical protein K2Y11_21255 [bacterium]|nr:hypothetical protein [bacterium]